MFSSIIVVSKERRADPKKLNKERYKPMRTKTKNYVILVTEESTHSTVYSDRTNSLIIANFRASRLRAIYGCDNIVIVDTRTGEVIEGL